MVELFVHGSGPAQEKAQLLNHRQVEVFEHVRIHGHSQNAQEN